MPKTRFGHSITESAMAVLSTGLDRYIEVLKIPPKWAENRQRIFRKGVRALGRPKKSPSPQGQKPQLTDNQWRGLEKECRGYQNTSDRQKDGWPSRTPAQTVASAASVTRQAVHKWRKDPQYRRGLYWLMCEKSSERVEHIAENDPGFKEFCRESSARSTED